MSSTQHRKRRREPKGAESQDAGASSHAHASSSTPDAEEAALAELVFGAGGASSDAVTFSTAGAGAGAERKQKQKQGAKAPAWADADDAKEAVELAASARLRKLRTSHGETVISGQEYQERARARLAAAGGSSDAPDWALAPSQRQKKRPAKAAGGSAAGAGAGSAVGGGDDEDDEAQDSDAGDEEEQAEVDDVEQLLRSAGPLTTRSSALAPDVLGITRLRDANVSDPARAVVQALGWHKDGAVMFTGSLDAKLRLFRVDGRKNPRLASVHLPDLPITSASWSGDCSEIIATGRRPFFYSYDVQAGKAHRIPRLLGREEKSLESCVVSPAAPTSSSALLAFLGAGGNVLLASARTKAWVATLKMDGQVRAAAFSRGPTGGGQGAGPVDYPDLLTVGTAGVVYTWDVRTMTCRGRHGDEGGSPGTALAVAPDGSRYAVGSTSGVVNVYDARTALDQHGSGASSSSGLFSPVATPKPAHTLLHLTTTVSNLTWHPGGAGDMLLAASQKTQDALRVMHGGTGRVYANWPTNRTPLHYVTAAAFSPHGGYLTVGNDRGRVLLYRLHHYGQV